MRVDVYPTQAGKPVLDLRAEDFDVLEDGKPQAIQTFEHVLMSPAGTQSLRSEPQQHRRHAAGRRQSPGPGVRALSRCLPRVGRRGLARPRSRSSG